LEDAQAILSAIHQTLAGIFCSPLREPAKFRRVISRIRKPGTPKHNNRVDSIGAAMHLDFGSLSKQSR
jgi:hypothetical protein